MAYCVATFHSVYEALNFEKFLKTANVKLELIPVPREISSSCGLAAKFAPEDRDNIETLIAAKNLVIDQIYTLEEKQKKKSLLNGLLRNRDERES